ncbi:M20/M25/M40 family metallo-hydrolase [Halobacillus shinanisalinarum]|uniref:M20/M25/M40 family metallo-hydrolase n=1 Tax=Halobacillus shinanisalinarum TaxID=2932258 RepID=UPI00210469C8|nr:M20/M25/M40 family metallo-hydrolase [Halobacillus shinanisalinarum]
MESLMLTVNRQRLLETLKVSSSIGCTKNGGLNRLALTEEDRVMRNQFITWLHDEGLDVRIDDFGNIYGRRKGKLNDKPVIAVGSHLDTQPCGGRYDGILGVLTALEVIRVLNENHIETDYPIEIINFTNEEGARFEPPMLGSGEYLKA